MKRIFIGLKISNELENEIKNWEEKWHKIPVKWINPKNIHITLVPPQYVNNTREIVKKLQTLKGQIGPIEISFKKVSFGPPGNNPRLIWAEGEIPEKIKTLKINLYEIMGEIFKPAEKTKPFLLHMTLARFKPQNFQKFPVENLNEKIFWKDTANSIVLFESKLSKQGADYEILEEIGL